MEYPKHRQSSRASPKPSVKNSEKFFRDDPPEPGDLDVYRPFDPSRGGSPFNDNDIVTASEGQAQLRGRKNREASSVCTGLEGPDGVLPTQGRGLVLAVPRKKNAMAVIPARAKPRLRTQSRPASHPLSLMMVSLRL